MNYQITELSRWGQFLYKAGLKSKHIRSHGDARDLKRLHEACENAELLLRMQEESRRLFGAAAREPLSGRDWQAFAKLRKRMHPSLQRFIQDADLYEWPTLVTAFIPEFAMPGGEVTADREIPTAEALLGEDVNGG